MTFSILRMPSSATRTIRLRPPSRTTTTWWRSRSRSTWKLPSTENFSKAKKVVSEFLSRDHPNRPARPSAAAASSASGPWLRKRTWPRWSRTTPEREPSSLSPLRRTSKPSGSPTGKRLYYKALILSLLGVVHKLRHAIIEKLWPHPHAFFNKSLVLFSQSHWTFKTVTSFMDDPLL